MWRCAQNCGHSAVTVHHGRRHPRHVAEADPNGPCDQETSLLLDTVVDVPVVKVVPAEYEKLLFFWKMTSDNGHTTVPVFEADFAVDSAPRAVFLRVLVAVHKTADFPQLQFITVVDTPFVAQTQILMVHLFDTVIYVPVGQVRRVPQVPSWRSLLCSHSCTW